MSEGSLTQRDILIGLDKKVDDVRDAVATLVEKSSNQADVLDDHETRIRALEEHMPDDAKARISALERFRFAFPSLAFLAFLCSVAMLVLYASGGLK